MKLDMRKVSLLLLISSTIIIPLVSPNYVKAEAPPIVSITPRYINLYNYSVGETFTVNVSIFSPDIAIWSGQIGIGFNKDVLECISFAKGPAIDPTWLWMPGTIRNDQGYVTYSGWSCVAGQEPGWTGTGTFITYTFKVKSYCEDDVLLFLTNKIEAPDAYYRIKLCKNVAGEIIEITQIILDGAAPAVFLQTKHDLAIKKIKCLQTVAYVGDVVKVEVYVENKGDFTEECIITLYADQNVRTFFDEYLIDTVYITGVSPGSTVSVLFSWNTSNVKIGSYWFSAILNNSSPDAFIEDNVYVKGAYLGGICEKPGVRRFDLATVLLQLTGSLAALVITLLVCIGIFKLLMCENFLRLFRKY
ncbi:MAG: CARDB domain-containing protein [Candidatus Bathyarchaeia archaeon]